jgi:hypothetical protein
VQPVRLQGVVDAAEHDANLSGERVPD